MKTCTRRNFMFACAGSIAASQALDVRADDTRGFNTRGVVLTPDDLSLNDWPQRASAAKLTTIGIHHQNSPQAVVDWIQSDRGQRFLESCKVAKLSVEYELHAMRELLPRSLFSKEPRLFRVDEKGERNPDANCCVHSTAALDEIASRAANFARVLRPTTGRYYYWGEASAMQRVSRSGLTRTIGIDSEIQRKSWRNTALVYAKADVTGTQDDDDTSPD